MSDPSIYTTKLYHVKLPTCKGSAGNGNNLAWNKASAEKFATNKSRMQLQAWSSAPSATAAAQWYWRMERVREIIIKSRCSFAETAQSVPRDRRYKSQCQWEATDLYGKGKYSVVVQNIEINAHDAVLEKRRTENSHFNGMFLFYPSICSSNPHLDLQSQLMKLNSDAGTKRFLHLIHMLKVNNVKWKSSGLIYNMWQYYNNIWLFSVLSSADVTIESPNRSGSKKTVVEWKEVSLN